MLFDVQIFHDGSTKAFGVSFFLTLWTYIYSLYLDMYVVHIWTVLLFNYINFCDATLVGGVVFTWQA